MLFSPLRSLVINIAPFAYLDPRSRVDTSAALAVDSYFSTSEHNHSIFDRICLKTVLGTKMHLMVAVRTLLRFRISLNIADCILRRFLTSSRCKFFFVFEIPHSPSSTSSFFDRVNVIGELLSDLVSID